tara:strand:- start:464 stop:1027 length:564 start_codon:yes stop_codon:yes gene_type:complete
MKNFSYKGSRKYIHVTDIYNNLIINYKYKNLDILFKKKIFNQPKIIFLNKLIKNQRSKVANCSIKISDKKKTNIIFIYDSKKKIATRYGYDEKLFYNFFRIKKLSCECNFSTSMSSIEVLVALTKFFHLKKLRKHNWFFSRLKLVKKLKENNFKIFSIYLKKNYLDMFTILDIYQSNKYIGEIQFSR